MVATAATNGIPTAAGPIQEASPPPAPKYAKTIWSRCQQNTKAKIRFARRWANTEDSTIVPSTILCAAAAARSAHPTKAGTWVEPRGVQRTTRAHRRSASRRATPLRAAPLTQTEKTQTGASPRSAPTVPCVASPGVASRRRRRRHCRHHHRPPPPPTCVCLNKRSKQSNHGAEPKRNETKEGAEAGSRKREEALEAMHKAYHTITMEEVPQWPCRCCRSLAAVFDSRNARDTTKNNTRQETRTLKWFVPERLYSVRFGSRRQLPGFYNSDKATAGLLPWRWYGFFLLLILRPLQWCSL